MPKANAKRLHIVLPEKLYDEVQQVSLKHDIQISDILRRFIKLGLIAVKLEETEGSALILKEGDSSTEVRMLMTA